MKAFYHTCHKEATMQTLGQYLENQQDDLSKAIEDANHRATVFISKKPVELRSALVISFRIATDVPDEDLPEAINLWLSKLGA